MQRPVFSIKCGKKSLTLGRRTAIMGILNVTPDSFSDGNLYFKNASTAVERASQMLKEGAAIIDIGGESTRPGSEFVTTKEEARRVVPVIKKMRASIGNNFLISVDTYKAQVADEALSAGADIVNSLSGFSFDGKLAGVVKDYGCQLIIYHIKGKPKTMQKGEIKYKNVIKDITAFFKSQVKIAVASGINRKQLMIDPGIGFGKTMDQNLEIITGLGKFSSLNLPIAIGISRKSHLGLLLKEELDLVEAPGPMERLEAALAETAIAIDQGAHIVRTHDVLQTKRFVASVDAILKNN